MQNDDGKRAIDVYMMQLPQDVPIGKEFALEFAGDGARFLTTIPSVSQVLASSPCVEFRHESIES